MNLAVFLGALAGLSPYEEVDPPGATEGVISNVQVGAEHVINAILDPPGAPERDMVWYNEILYILNALFDWVRIIVNYFDAMTIKAATNTGTSQKMKIHIM